MVLRDGTRSHDDPEGEMVAALATGYSGEAETRDSFLRRRDALRLKSSAAVLCGSRDRWSQTHHEPFKSRLKIYV